MKSFLFPAIRCLRPFQWTKNLAVFAAPMFNGQLFNPEVLLETLIAFVVFCLASSASYVFNDLIDAPYDRRHPVKKDRPIASGAISPFQAKLIILMLLALTFWLSSLLPPSFLVLLLIFLVVHLAYSFYLKKVAVLDIIMIAFSFILRTLGGELATGYHLPVWLMFTVVFLALFIASGKRRGEIIANKSGETRTSLIRYRKALLNFYNSIFAVATLVSYALFTYLSQPASFSHPRVKDFLLENMPYLLGRKWLMLSTFPVVFGIMRYSQLVFDRSEGERPEKLLIFDIPLLLIVLFWGLMIALIIYVL
ncbi:MAG: decaprenyl-phosphate phosphoribosyltransferase [Patescibacteria group bacterium]